MALPGSPNTLKLSQLQGEFGGSNPIKLSEYYRNAGYTTSNNTNVPTGGNVKLSQFYNAMKYIPGYQEFTSSGTFNIPAWVSTVTIRAIGGGGGGSQGGFDNGDNGIAGRPGSAIWSSYNVVPGSSLSIAIGGGGGAGGNGGNTTITGTINGAYQSVVAAGGAGAGIGNSPGGGGGAWYLDANWQQTTDSSVANSAYTSWFGPRTGGYSLGYVYGDVNGWTHANGTDGVLGGAGGGGGGINGGYKNDPGGNGGSGYVLIQW